ncbi:unnamed protein product [Rotaria sordida]|uniref:Uncharacterized protein n=1 Tax=Rotaria sordida TaxID=392033 RepID=A0A814JFW0_9BILA|nr:unnamed protein product [Rotaria sordida]CAF0959651.1 unnamed protein product [Rotaria sordida]CAF1037494.1 unnamed protein product [Rotaria sordida]CAF1051543.1 unnamed protein product [Rotaria sordida]CAF1240622.1 unnamed protein product [Rotaria sordida]
MAGSDTSILLYDTITGRFTKYGRSHLRSFCAHTPYPSANQLKEIAEETGCPMLKLRVYANIIRIYGYGLCTHHRHHS